MPNMSSTPCRSLEEFWNAITPSKEGISPVFYRGHGDATWKLEPSIFRTGNKEYQGELPYEEFQYSGELNYLCDFVKYCDQARLPVPGDSQKMRELLDSLYKHGIVGSYSKDWPPCEFYELIALMQHFSFPTRFLDWTRSPFIAAFFAASEVINNEKIQAELDSKEMAVWRLDSSEFDYCYTAPFEFIRVPPRNRNMYAQYGVFTLLRANHSNGLTPHPSSLEDFFENKVDERDQPILTKITLPAFFAIDVIERCDCYSINHATVFPDYTGVSQELKFQKKVDIYKKK